MNVAPFTGLVGSYGIGCLERFVSGLGHSAKRHELGRRPILIRQPPADEETFMNGVVFSEKAIRRGSCVVTTRSMWKRSARNRRSATPAAPVQAVNGSTFARAPCLECMSCLASGVEMYCCWW